MKFISFDMDGTLIPTEYTDWVWGHGIPSLYAKKTGSLFEEAKSCVEAQYRKVGEGALEWYDIKHWFELFQLGAGWKPLMEAYADKITLYPDVVPLLSRLKNDYALVLTSNAGREFIDVEMKATGLAPYFSRIFSVTSDFGRVKKTADVYCRICDLLGTEPQEIVHVGDHYEFDYLVPQTVGIRSFFLDRSAQRQGSSIVWSLGELEERLFG
jgi:HAD superfamily hydrolase (TIGR01549 family)